MIKIQYVIVVNFVIAVLFDEFNFDVTVRSSLTTGGQPRVVAVWPALRDVLHHEANQTSSQSDGETVEK